MSRFGFVVSVFQVDTVVQGFLNCAFKLLIVKVKSKIMNNEVKRFFIVLFLVYNEII